MYYRYDDYAGEFKARAKPYWEAAVAFLQGKGGPPLCPYQVEIHLKEKDAPVCLLRCADCHGQFLRSNQGLSLPTYLELLYDLQELGVPSIVLSGAYSDPTTDQHLLLRVLQTIACLWPVKLHTYCLGLTEKIQLAILRAAWHDQTKSSYVTLSKVTMSPHVYYEMCHPSISPDDALGMEDRNARSFLERCHASNNENDHVITVRFNCRLTKINSLPRHLADLLRWVKDLPLPVPIRFTTDFPPNHAPSYYQQKFRDEIYLGPEDALGRIKKAVEDSDFPWDRVSFRNASVKSYEGPCLNGLLLSAVATSGDVFPCQSQASPKLLDMAYGNIENVRFSEIWRNFVHNYDRMVPTCQHCVTPCESQINVALKGEIDDAGKASLRNPRG